MIVLDVTCLASMRIRKSGVTGKKRISKQIMNISLIIPKYGSQDGDFYSFPLGFGYVSSVLRLQGYCLNNLNLNHFPSPFDQMIETHIRTHNINVVCLGGQSMYYSQIKIIIAMIRRIDPQIVVVVGGGLVTSAPTVLLEALKPDFLIIGEAEHTIVALLAALDKDKDYSQIEGLGYLRNNEKIITPKRSPIMDLDTIPFPDFESFGVEEYFLRQYPVDSLSFYFHDKPRSLPMISSRSCPLKCTFCFHPLGQQYRKRSWDNFFEELELLVNRHQINHLQMADELFDTSHKSLYEFCERMKPFNLKWECQLRVNIVTDDLLKRLRDCGCYYLGFGIESAHNGILKAMKKHINVSQIDHALSTTRKNQLGIQGNLIFGSRDETLSTAMDSLSWWVRNYYYHIFLAGVIPFPGSEDHLSCVEDGTIAGTLDFIERGCPQINMSKMTDVQYQEFFSKTIIEYQNKARQFGEIIYSKNDGYSDLKQAYLYTAEIRCPHCQNSNRYRNLFQREGCLPFKLGCRHCNQRFDVHPEIFTEYVDLFERDRKLLAKLIKDQKMITITPCVPSFLSYLSVLSIDWTKLNIQNSMDANENMVGTEYLGLFPTYIRAKLSLQRYCNGNVILLPPSKYAGNIRDEIVSYSLECIEDIFTLAR